MSVTNGQQCDQTVLNGAFVSKLTDSTVISRLSLNRTGSGGLVPDVQQSINDHDARLTVAEGDIGTLQVDLGVAESEIDALQASSPLGNFSATSDPTPTDDSGQNYAVGSRWINITNDRAFVAVDVTIGAAIWKRTDKERLAVSFFTTLNMGTTNITDGAYVELVADTGAAEVKKVSVFYPAGSILIFALGAASSEVNQFLMQPGGGVEEVSIPPNSRVSLRLVAGQTAVTSGVIAVNFLTEV